MDNFKQFLKKGESEYPIMPEPTHGAHSVPEDDMPIIPDVNHGNHAVEEDAHEYPQTTATRNWADKHDNDHLGSNVEEVHNNLMKHDTLLHNPHFDHLYDYTSQSYHTNNALIAKAKGQTYGAFNPDNFDKSWDHKKQSYVKNSKTKITRLVNKEKKEHNDHVKGIDAGLEHNQPLSHDLHVYHGTQKFNPDALASQHPQRKIKSAAFLSTSIDKDRAMKFAGTHLSTQKGPINYNYDRKEDDPGRHLLHIHLKPGQKGAYMGDNSRHELEKEFLIPRNTTLKVHPEPTVLHNGTKVWHAHVVKR
jgi:hypothetical protein